MAKNARRYEHVARILAFYRGNPGFHRPKNVGKKLRILPQSLDKAFGLVVRLGLLENEDGVPATGHDFRENRRLRWIQPRPAP